MSLGDLLLVCVLLQMASVLAGWAPLFVLSSGKRRWVSTLGVGALIGTAFVVVIPAGVHTMYLPPRIPPMQAPQQTATDLLPSAAADDHSWDDSDTPAAEAAAAAAGVSALGPWSRPGATAIGSDKASLEVGLTKIKANTGSAKAKAASAAGSNQHTEHEHEHEHTAEKAHAPNGGARRLLDAAVATDAAHTASYSHAHDGHTHDFKRSATNDATLDDHAVDAVALALVQRSERLYAAATQTLAGAALAEPILVCFGESHASHLMGASMALGFVAMLLMDRFFGGGSSGGSDVALLSPDDEESGVANGGASTATSSSSNKHGEAGELLSRGKSSSVGGTAGPGGNNEGGVAEREREREQGGRLVNPSSSPLVIGSSTPRTKSSIGQTPHTPGNQNHLSFPSPAAVGVSAGGGGAAGGASANHGGASTAAVSGLRHDVNVLLGVFVYALVEGVTLGTMAVGSASASSSGGVAPGSIWNVLPALLLHHAPSAFGVSAFLIYKGRPALRVRKSVMLYSSVAPLVALVTFLVLASPGVGGVSTDPVSGQRVQWDPLSSAVGFGRLGLMALFAGGAFLFTIAVHILPEIQAQNGGGHSHGGGGAAAAAAHGHGGRGSSDDVGLIGSASPAIGGSAGNSSATAARVATPASRHEETSLLSSSASGASASLGGAGAGGSAAAALAEECANGMPWRHVWALVLGLLMPLGASMILPRNPLF